MLTTISAIAALFYSFGVAQVFTSWVVLVLSGFSAVAVYLGFPLLVQDEEAFTNLMTKLANTPVPSALIGIMVNILILSVVSMAFSPYIALAILPAYILSVALYVRAKNQNI